MSYESANIVWIDGEAFSPKHPKARALLSAGDSRKTSELERNPGSRTLGQVQTQSGLGQRFFILVTSYRKRLLDQDNLCCKYVIDLCRYAGVLPSDAPGTAEIKVCQEKVGPKEPERTRVEIWKI